MEKYKIGYTQGTFDMFHVGHLNLIKHAKEQCCKLIVGVNSDALVEQYKNKTPVIKEQNRVEIIEALKYVDKVIICDSLDKCFVWNRLHFDVIFIGDDWKGNARWMQTERDLAALGSKVIYLKHTDGISSTILRTHVTDQIKE